MKLQEKTLFIYIKKISKQWYSIIGLSLLFLSDLVPNLVDKKWSPVTPNTVKFLCFFVLFIAGYKVYKELYDSVPDEFQPEKPQVDLKLIEGNSYQYLLDETGQLMRVHDGEMPKGIITINGRIENKSSNIIKIVSLSGWFFGNKSFYDMMLPEIHVENKQIQFPISVNPKSSFEFQYVSSMHPGNLTEAQIAVKSSNENCLETIFEARINYIYGDNEEEEKKENFTISLKPFTNLLVRYWQNKDKKEILKLAKKIK